MEPIKLLNDVWLEIRAGKVVQIGPEGELMPDNISDDAYVINAEGMVATPGFVDCHAHPVFYGTRQSEFVRRCSGETYQQIAASGGGILSSVKGVRFASEEQLTARVREHYDGFLSHGTTTVEAKSGYGLTLNDELKSLRAIRTASMNHPIDVSPTLLGAHVVPPEFRNQADKYVDIVCDEMIPQVVNEKLAEAVDVFLEQGAYNLSQTRRIFEATKKAGLGIHLHADQFSVTGGAELSAEFNALSADHMDQTDEAGIAALSSARVSVVLLPGAVFFLGLEQYAPARKMIEAGCRIALSTDFNPGSSPTQSMALIMSIACIKMGLTPQEALWATTLGGSYAINRSESVGTLLPGYDADICLWSADDIDYIPYSYGNMMPKIVIKKGTAVKL